MRAGSSASAASTGASQSLCSSSLSLPPQEAHALRRARSLSLFRNLDGPANELDSWSALFIDGSAFNHSCVANTYHKTLGDVLVVRARTSIKKGKEVYLSYAPLECLHGASRAIHLARHFGLGGCPCASCVEERWDLDEIVENREAILNEVLDIAQELEHTADTASGGATSQRWNNLIDLTGAMEGSYFEDCTQPQPLLAITCATALRAASFNPSPPLDDEQCTDWYETLLRASGTRIHDSAPAWRLDPPPLYAPMTVVRNSLSRARASLKAGGNDGRARALGYLSLCAQQSRIEHGDDLDRFWARRATSLEGLEPLREPLAELLGEARRRSKTS